MKNSKKNNNRRRKGFTLSEVMIVVAILAILAALSTVAIVSYQRDLTALELDATAKELFLAAQNHLSMADGQNFQTLADNAYGTKDAATYKVNVNGVETPVDNIYYYVVGTDKSVLNAEGSALSLILPPNSIDATIRDGGSYIICYQKDPAQILDVFYCEPNGKYPHTFIADEYTTLMNSYRSETADRKHYGADKAVIGYYGGAANANQVYYNSNLKNTTLNAPVVTVENGDKLIVEVTDTNCEINGTSVTYNGGLTLAVEGKTSGIKMEIPLLVQQNASFVKPVEGVAYVVYDQTKGKFTVTLDDITTSGGSFAVVTAGTGLIPGEDLSIYAYASDSFYFSNIATSPAVDTNSLFANVAAETGTAEISSIRHLENLDPMVSAFSAAGVVKAVQTCDLAWGEGDVFTNAASVYVLGKGTQTAAGCYYPVTPNTASGFEYAGGGFSVSGIVTDETGNAGLFGTLTGTSSNGVVVSDLQLVDFDIKGACAGALAGSVDYVTVSNVYAYNTSNVDTIGISGTVAAGGLIGSATHADIAECAASLYVKSTGDFAGGFVGMAGLSTIKSCYSGGHTEKADYLTAAEGPGHFNVSGAVNVGGFAGSLNTSTVSYCYTTCTAYGPSTATVGGFVGTTSTAGISRSYAAGKVFTPNGTKYVTTKSFIGTSADNSGSFTDCIYLADRATSAAGIQAKTADDFEDMLTDLKTRHGGTGDHAPAVPYDKSLAANYANEFSYLTVYQLHYYYEDSFTGDEFTAKHYGDWYVPLAFAAYTLDNGDELLLKDISVEGIKRLTLAVSDPDDEDRYKEIVIYINKSVDPVTTRVAFVGTCNAQGNTTWNSDAETLAQFPEDFAVVSGDKMTITLDSITRPGLHFDELFGDVFEPGEDIEVRLVIGKGAFSQILDVPDLADAANKYVPDKTDDTHLNAKQTNSLFAEVTGTTDLTAQISTIRHLQNLDTTVSGVTEDIVFAQLDDNIEIIDEFGTDGAYEEIYATGDTTTPVVTNSFYGIANSTLRRFDGDGCTIDGLVINTDDCAGLFRQVDNYLNVENLMLKDCQITSTGDCAGAIVGLADGADYLNIENVAVIGEDAIVRGSTAAGGLVGYSDDSDITIDNCAVSLYQLSASGCAGGLIGEISGGSADIDYSYVGGRTSGGVYDVSSAAAANIYSSASAAGGFIGRVDSGSISINQAFSAASVGTNNQNVGGLIGSAPSSGTITLNTVYTIAPAYRFNGSAKTVQGVLVGSAGTVNVTDVYYLAEVYTENREAYLAGASEPVTNLVGSGTVNGQVIPVGYKDVEGNYLQSAITTMSLIDDIHIDSALNTEEYPYDIYTAFNFDELDGRTYYGDWQPVANTEAFIKSNFITFDFYVVDPTTNTVTVLDGKSASVDLETGGYVALPGESELPVIPGYKFSGWYRSPDGTDLFAGTEANGVNIDVGGSGNDKVNNIYACYTAEDRFVVEFYYDDPTVEGENWVKMSSRTVKSGESVEYNFRTFDGYRFVGWYKEKTFEHGIDDSSFANVTENITAYARYIKAENYLVKIQFRDIPDYDKAGTVRPWNLEPLYIADYVYEVPVGETFENTVAIPDLSENKLVLLTAVEGEFDKTTGDISTRGLLNADGTLTISVTDAATYTVVYGGIYEGNVKYHVTRTFLNTADSSMAYSATASYVESEEYMGIANSAAIVPDIEVEGFTLENYTPKTIKSDESTNVTLVYSRNQYTLSFEPDTVKMFNPVQLYYGQSIQSPILTTTNDVVGEKPYSTLLRWDVKNGSATYTAANVSGNQTSGYSISFSGASTMPAYNVVASAVWNNNAKYTVYYWGQNADDDDYTLVGSSVRTTSQTNDEVGAVLKTSTLNTLQNNPVGVDTEHFTYSHRDENVVIKANGTSVVNIYYDRKEYTLYFYEGILNVSFLRKTPIASITARYGADVHDQWPTYVVEIKGLITGITIYRKETNTWYMGSTNGILANWTKWQYSINTMPGEDQYFFSRPVFNQIFDNGVDVSIYLEGLDSTYTKSESNSYQSFFIDRTNYQDYPVIPGYTLLVRSGDLSGFRSNYEGDVAASTDPVSTALNSYTDDVKLYYSRNSYTIQFYENGAASTPGKTKTFKYGQSLSGQGEPNPTFTSYNLNDYDFVDWYTNTECVGTPFRFDGNTMPAENVKLYGKWVHKTLNLNFDVNWPAGETIAAPTLGLNSATVYKHELLASNDTVFDGTDWSSNFIPSFSTPQDKYVFLGWYTEPTGGIAVSGSTAPTESATLYAHWGYKYTKLQINQFLVTTASDGTDQYSPLVDYTDGIDYFTVEAGKTYTVSLDVQSDVTVTLKQDGVTVGTLTAAFKGDGTNSYYPMITSKDIAIPAIITSTDPIETGFNYCKYAGEAWERTIIYNVLFEDVTDSTKNITIELSRKTETIDNRNYVVVDYSIPTPTAMYADYHLTKSAATQTLNMLNPTAVFNITVDTSGYTISDISAVYDGLVHDGSVVSGPTLNLPDGYTISTAVEKTAGDDYKNAGIHSETGKLIVTEESTGKSVTIWAKESEINIKKRIVVLKSEDYAWKSDNRSHRFDNFTGEGACPVPPTVDEGIETSLTGPAVFVDTAAAGNEGFAAGEGTFNYFFTASIKDPGTRNNVFVVTTTGNTNADNYSFIYEYGTLKVVNSYSELDPTIIGNPYIVKFDGNGGTGTMADQEFVYGTGKKLSKNLFTRTGYSFDGWMLSASYVERQYRDEETVLDLADPRGVEGTPEITLYAKWDGINYVINFNANGGEGTIAGIAAVYGDPVELPEVGNTEESPFKKTGYNFVGWNNQADGLGDRTFADGETFYGEGLTTVADGTATLYAQWEPKQFTVTFNTNNENLVEDAEPTVTTPSAIVFYDAPYGELSTASCGGYAFDGWFTEPVGGEQVTETTVVQILADQTLYAHWHEVDYNVSFDTCGGTTTTPEPIVVKFNKPYGDDEAGRHFPDPGTITGYTFRGWNPQIDGTADTDLTEASLVRIASDHTLYAIWKTEGYEITYTGVDDAVNNNPTEYTIESDDITLVAPTKTGYTFTGWTGTDVTDPAMSVTIAQGSIGDRTFEAHWTPNTYTVTFNANGGEGTMTPQARIYDDGVALKANEFIRVGYKFIGWKFNETVFEDQTTENITPDSGEVELVAQWEIIIYNLTYDLAECPNDPENPNTYTVETDDITLVNPTWIGHTFTGWTGTGITGSSTDVTIAKGSVGDRSYTATWSIDSYVVTLNKNNGTVNSGDVTGYTYGVGATLPTDITRTGYTFGGWFDNEGCTGTAVTTIGTEETGERTFWAKWTANDYTVTFDKNGGDAPNPASKTVTYDQAYGTLAAISRTGYTFDGWFTAASGGTEVKATDIVAITADQTLYAQWTANTYTVTFNKNGGSDPSMANKIVTYDAAYGELAEVSRTGYIFDGWFTAQTGGTVVANDSIYTVADNQTLYAHWTARTDTAYVVKHYKQDIGADTYTLADTDNFTGTSDSTVTPAVKSYTGFTAPSTQTVTVLPDGSLVVTYNYTRNTYKVTFNGNNGTAPSPAEKTVIYGDTYHDLASVTRTGYTFTGWFTAAEGGTEVTSTSTVTITAAQTLYAHWTANAYTVKFDANGGSGTMDDQPRTYDDGVAIPVSAFTKTGYHFNGWKLDSTDVADQSTANLATEDDAVVTLKVQWAANTDTPYVVNHYKQNLDGTGYTLADTDNLTGTSDSIVTPTLKTYTGFTAPASQTVTVAPDGSTVVTYQYSRNVYTVHFNKNSEFATGTMADQSRKYDDGAALTANAFDRTGYTFTGWALESGYALADQYVGDLTEDTNVTVNLYAQWSANTDTPYVVNHYKQNVGTDTYTLADTENLTGTSDATVTPTLKTYTGFTAPSSQTVTIAPDGTTVVTYYYTRNHYIVRFNGNGSTSGSMADQTRYYGDGASLTVNAFGRTGYTFVGWALESGYALADQYVGDLTEDTNVTVNLYAQWSANTDTPYVVKHYKQNLDGTYPTDPTDTDNLIGTSDSTVTPTLKTYTGFTAPASQTVTIAPDGTTVVTYYYTRNHYIVRFNGNGSTSGSMADQTRYYGDGASLTANGFSRTGYTFTGWALESGYALADQYVGDLTEDTNVTVNLYAQWTPNTYTITLNTNGGTINNGNVTSYTYGIGATLPVDVTKNGSGFAGWYFNSDLSGEKITSISTTDSGNKELFAKWSALRQITVDRGSDSCKIYYIGIDGTENQVNSNGSIPEGSVVKVVITFDSTSNRSFGISPNTTIYSDASLDSALNYTGDSNSRYYYDCSSVTTVYFTMPSAKTSINCYSGTSGCITGDTLITMADGTKVMAKDIKLGDMVQTYDFLTGTIISQPVIAMEQKDAETVCEIVVTLDNGESLNIIESQSLFDMESKEFFEIGRFNYAEAVGRKIMVIIDNEICSAEITSVDASMEVLEIYEIATANNYSFFANDMLTVESFILCTNIFEINDEYRYDEEKMMEDIATYGLYTYDDFADIMSEEMFDVFNVGILKVAVGKGFITVDQIHEAVRLLTELNIQTSFEY